MQRNVWIQEKKIVTCNTTKRVVPIPCHTNKLEWYAVVQWEQLGEVRANHAQSPGQVRKLGILISAQLGHQHAQTTARKSPFKPKVTHQG